MRPFAILVVMCALACGDKNTDDTGQSDEVTEDGGTEDGGTDDGGTEDGGTEDGGTEDGGTEDGGTEDGGTDDGGSTPVDEDGDGVTVEDGDCDDTDPETTVCWQDVATGDDFTCGLTTEGQTICWGEDAPEPPDDTFKSIFAGTNEKVACGIRESGEPVCWGSTENIFPSGTTLTQIAFLSDAACGINTDGGLVCTDRYRVINYGDDTLPEGTFVDISGGGTALQGVCAIDAAENLVCWGGSAGVPIVDDQPDGSFTHVSMGEGVACARETSGSLQCWGSSVQDTEVAPSGTFIAVSVGGEHACGLRESGAGTCWGGWDLMGTNSRAPSIYFNKISLGDNHSCGLTESGRISCWHNNDEGEGDVPFADADDETVDGIDDGGDDDGGDDGSDDGSGGWDGDGPLIPCDDAGMFSEDCDGECFLSWDIIIRSGDGTCDEEPMNLNCEHFSWDGWDCALPDGVDDDVIVGIGNGSSTTTYDYDFASEADGRVDCEIVTTHESTGPITTPGCPFCDRAATITNTVVSDTCDPTRVGTVTTEQKGLNFTDEYLLSASDDGITWSYTTPDSMCDDRDVTIGESSFELFCRNDDWTGAIFTFEWTTNWALGDISDGGGSDGGGSDGGGSDGGGSDGGGSSDGGGISDGGSSDGTAETYDDCGEYSGYDFNITSLTFVTSVLEWDWMTETWEPYDSGFLSSDFLDAYDAAVDEAPKDTWVPGETSTLRTLLESAPADDVMPDPWGALYEIPSAPESWDSYVVEWLSPETNTAVVNVPARSLSFDHEGHEFTYRLNDVDVEGVLSEPMGVFIIDLDLFQELADCGPQIYAISEYESGTGGWTSPLGALRQIHIEVESGT